MATDEPAIDETHLLRPRFDAADAARIAREAFGLEGETVELPSERDRNFRVGQGHVLKLASAGEERAVLELQDAALARAAAAAPGLVPAIHPATDGARLAQVRDAGGRSHLARCVTWLEGALLAEVRPHSPALLEDLGALLGRVDRGMAGLEHPAAGRELRWDLRHGAEAIADCRGAILDPARGALVDAVLARFGGEAGRRAADLRLDVIQGDANDHNVLVREDLSSQRVAGLIDFGDLVRSWVLGEVAIAAAYAMLGKRDPLGAACRVLAGYHREHPIPEEELAVLLDLVRLRLATSVSISAQRASSEPDNAYLFVTEAPAWELLAALAEVPGALALARFRDACGLEPDPAGARVAAFLARAQVAPVVGEALGPDDVAAVDLSVGSAEVDALGFAAGAGVAAARLADRRAQLGVRALAGGRGEARDGYPTDAYLVPGEDGDEHRTVHLGVDVWVEAGAPVRAPLAGEVVSAADNDAPLDYGPTVILRHETGAGDTFHTLYGHLAPGCLDALAPGQRLAAGERFAEVGAPARNGGWPPHLHLQVFTTPLGDPGDFPGVAPPSQRSVWESICPDPGPLLGAGCPAPAAAPDPQALRTARAARLGGSLSLSYRRPLTIVRGRGTRLVDHEGRAFLDAVNNVPHVGHAHPRVVAAGQAQMAVLNTNTRYLHPLIGEYAERLAALLPDPLEVLFFVNSGSEANELALRMARTHTGQREVVVVEGGYHGNTGQLVELSSYKFRGAGGFEPPAHVIETPLPDPFRGRHGADGPRYAAEVAAAVEGRRPAAFLHESLVGCGGQIVPPPGWLPGAYAAVRAAGGVCIADEVQTGFGRAGTHMWSFELQGVVPDLVTLGKPMGNGHPLAAVATTREVAASFETGMEWFNTFGGNPVSCAIGMAVLDVLEDEGLRENAREVGAGLLAGLGELAARHALIGDVRGVGLYVGVELVLDRATRAPAGEHASRVAERMRDRGVLISTDGPHHNVLKIKPPLCFSAADAATLVAALDATLAETALVP